MPLLIKPQVWPFCSSPGISADISTDFSDVAIGTSPEVAFSNPAAMSQFDQREMGAALTYANFQVKFSGTIASPFAGPTPLPVPNVDGGASGWSYSYTLGFFWHANNGAKIGFSYKSRVNADLTGTGSFGSGSSKVTSNNFQTKVFLPEHLLLSVALPTFHRWTVMGSVYYYLWSHYQSLILKNIPAPFIGPLTTTILLNLHNTWAGSLGFNYQYNHNVILKMGFGYQGEPSPSGYQSLELPPTEGWTLGFGGEVKVDKSKTLDFGFMRLFENRTNINNSKDGSKIIPVNVGVSRVSATLIGMQFNWKF